MFGEQMMYYDEETFRKKCEIRRQKEQKFAAEILRLVREAQKEQPLGDDSTSEFHTSQASEV